MSSREALFIDILEQNFIDDLEGIFTDSRARVLMDD